MLRHYTEQLPLLEEMYKDILSNDSRRDSFAAQALLGWGSTEKLSTNVADFLHLILNSVNRRAAAIKEIEKQGGSLIPKNSLTLNSGWVVMFETNWEPNPETWAPEPIIKIVSPDRNQVLRLGLTPQHNLITDVLTQYVVGTDGNKYVKKELHAHRITSEQMTALQTFAGFLMRQANEDEQRAKQLIATSQTHEEVV